MRFNYFGIPLIILLTSCKPPLAPIQGQAIFRITIVPLPHENLKGHTTTLLTDKEEIAFVVRHLSNLKAKGYDHSWPEFNLFIETTSGATLKLRVADNEVGPDAPASANNMHWFPRDKTAYKSFRDFLFQKTLHP